MAKLIQLFFTVFSLWGQYDSISGMKVQLSSSNNGHHLDLRNRIALDNLRTRNSGNTGNSRPHQAGLNRTSLLPNDKAPPFVLNTLSGSLKYPSDVFVNSSVLFVVYDNQSSYVDCMWHSDKALLPLLNTPLQYLDLVFIPAGNEDPLLLAKWMFTRLSSLGPHHNLKNFHFVTDSLSQLTNWIPTCLTDWSCSDHGCGYDQLVILNKDHGTRTTFKRLDARYDWLPSPVKFINHTLPLDVVWNSCSHISNASSPHAVALVYNNGCTIFEQITNVQSAGYQGAVVMMQPGEPLQDISCEGKQCSSPLTIFATAIPYSQSVLYNGTFSVKFQNTPSHNFYMAINVQGKLAEVGWMLYPSTSFLVWQAQWMEYQKQLESHLKRDDLLVPLFDNAIMKGSKGVLANVTLPPLEKLRTYSTFELQVNLSCPGSRDEDCPAWDRTVSLHVCCDRTSPLCDVELGRWITPFRRRIGIWITDVSPLLPLLTSRQCTLRMYTDSWASPWKPSAAFRFSNPKSNSSASPYPAAAKLLFSPGATFDHNYNNHFKPFYFQVNKKYKKVVIYAVITGHGSDENGCGEFCVTSHHFDINGHTYNITFDNAGTALGCANRSSLGVVPNEHGTWLYGRDGWCDGLQVDPWVIDITTDIKRNNVVQYYGWYQGKTPNPKHNPGIMSLYSYLIFYQ
ncbi:uncharacterized protein LOC115221110 [Argonauta hians]